MNMLLHNTPDTTIWQNDTIANPQNIADDKLMKFQVVVPNPLFSLEKWDSGFLSDDKTKMSASLDLWELFDWGIPPVLKGDYAFNLNIPRYVDAFEEEEPADTAAVKAEINNIERELAEIQTQMTKYLSELGI